MEINTEEYVVGFIFSKGKGSVLLIRKTKPEWQAGCYNGIGGKIEECETSIQAMIRECFEETGLSITNWRKYCTLHTAVEDQTPGVVIYFFWSEVSLKYLHSAHSDTDEELCIYPSRHLPPNIINNLSWHIPMAMAKSEVEAIVTETGIHHEDI